MSAEVATIERLPIARERKPLATQERVMAIGGVVALEGYGLIARAHNSTEVVAGYVVMLCGTATVYASDAISSWIERS